MKLAWPFFSIYLSHNLFFDQKTSFSCYSSSEAAIIILRRFSGSWWLVRVIEPSIVGVSYVKGLFSWEGNILHHIHHRVREVKSGLIQLNSIILVLASPNINNIDELSNVLELKYFLFYHPCFPFIWSCYIMHWHLSPSTFGLAPDMPNLQINLEIL